jgi:AraC family transcriptional regulator of adaptative response/methylated-DNA-[protein]-cysteine methyltransferase
MPDPTSDQGRRVQSALEFIADHVDAQPDLKTIAAEIGLAPTHCQRVFSRFAGVSPKKFLQFLTIERAKDALARSESVLDAAFDAGLSGPGRLHDLFVTLEAATPGEYKARGAGMTFGWGVVDGPFGPTLLMWSPRGLTGLAFLADRSRDDALSDLAGHWRHARLARDQPGAEAWGGRVFARFAGRPIDRPLPLYIGGTPFQVKVWEALLRVPPGALVAYETIARAIGQPTAARAIGNAVGANPIAYLVPCHRVIRRTAEIGDYRWGAGVKRLLIGAEGLATAA